jgi:hypothetical protein
MQRVNNADPATVPSVIGRRLNESELESYRHVPRSLATQVRIVEVRALPGGYVGMTLRNLILLSERVADDGTSSLLAHELVHVQQWHEEGRARFLWRYIWDFTSALVRTRSWSRSYRAIRHEVEAREAATRWSRSHQAGRGA